MKLDRDINANGMGKYALIKLRSFDALKPEDKANAETCLSVLRDLGILDLGLAKTESEFFVMRLKDKYAYRALAGYVQAIDMEKKPDLEYAKAIQDLQFRSGPYSPFCKLPD